MSLKFPAKDPNDILDEKFVWSNWLAANEVIYTSNVTVAPAGLTILSSTHDDTSVTFHVSGGTANVTYTVTCEIVTSNGNTANRSATIQVKTL